MANRWFDQFQYAYEKDTVSVYGYVDIGASGAVSGYSGGGIASVVKESTAGQYTITLSDKFSRFLDFAAQVVDDAISQIMNVQVLENPATIQADVATGKSLTMQCLTFTSSSNPTKVAGNPADGARIMFKFVFRNTSVGPYDS